MNEQFTADSLRRRMMQLREKNHMTLSEMAKEIHCDKSTLSRIEHQGGATSLKKVIEKARDYCAYFQLSELQTEQFLRGQKGVVVDTSALMMRPELLDELVEEYSCVMIPEFVVCDLTDIMNKDVNDEAVTANELLYRIENYEKDRRVWIKNYSVPTESDHWLIVMADEFAKELGGNVDIIAYNHAITKILVKSIVNDASVNLIKLEEYSATKQNIMNMKAFLAVNDYYADSYDDIDTVLGIDLSARGEIDFNAYLANGYTLIIDTIHKSDVPFCQRREKIRWLILNGADVNKRDCQEYDFPPITHAIKAHDYEMFDFLLHDCNADPNVCSRNPFSTGSINQNNERNTPFSANSISQKNDGNTPLMVAAWEDQPDMVRDLCNDERISLNQQDSNGFTALIKACYRGNIKCRDEILKKKPDERIQDFDGYTAQMRYREYLKMKDINE